MSPRTLFSTIFGISILSTFALRSEAQMSEQAARAKARDVVRSELHARVDFKADQFLGIQRDEDLEQTLEIASGKQPGLTYIYRVSPEGAEVKENAVVYHIWTDTDPLFIVVINPNSGGVFRVCGFGRDESLSEFEKLMTALKINVSSPDQAESVAELYRRVNPEHYDSLTSIPRLLELKQAAERQCQSDAKSFDVSQKAFINWWGRGYPLYSTLSFQQKALLHDGGYLVEWIVLSSPTAQNCGGAPLRAQLEISSDGQVSKLKFLPVRSN